MNNEEKKVKVGVSVGYVDYEADFIREFDSIEEADSFVSKELRKMFRGDHSIKRITAEYHDSNDIDIRVDYTER